MSLAEDLRGIAARCRAAAPHPAWLAPRAGHCPGWLDLLAAQIDDIAARVALIEHAPVSLGGGADNVVSLDRHRTGRAR